MDNLIHTGYYSDGKSIARWDGRRGVFWVWNNTKYVKFISAVRHIDDDPNGFDPKALVRSEVITDPIIF